MIPAFIDIGGPWKVLPPGVYDATIAEIEARFATSEHRKRLFSGFKKGIDNLRKAGCQSIFLNGSFITDKPKPKDYDVCWHPAGVNHNTLDPTFLDFSNNREKQKKIYYGEYFLTTSIADMVNPFYKFFQIDKETGRPKGIIHIRLV